MSTLREKKMGGGQEKFYPAMSDFPILYPPFPVINDQSLSNADSCVSQAPEPYSIMLLFAITLSYSAARSSQCI